MDFLVEKKIKREKKKMRKETMILFDCKYINLRETFPSWFAYIIVCIDASLDSRTRAVNLKFKSHVQS